MDGSFSYRVCICKVPNKIFLNQYELYNLSM